MIISPATNINIVSFPRIFCAIETIASLFGTTPVIPNPFSIIFPNGSRFLTIKSAPAPSIIYPSIGFKVPVISLLNGFFKAISPTSDISPNKNAGLVSISFPITFKKFILFPPKYFLYKFYFTNSLILSNTSSLIFFLFV